MSLHGYNLYFNFSVLELWLDFKFIACLEFFFSIILAVVLNPGNSSSTENLGV